MGPCSLVGPEKGRCPIGIMLFVEKVIFISVVTFTLLSRPICMAFCVLYSFPLIYVSAPVLVPHCLDLCGLYGKS